MTDNRFGIEWTRYPAPDKAHRAWQIIRAPKTGELSLTILSHDVLGCETHYWAGRTKPCLGARCEPCISNQQPRYHAYVAAWEHKTKRQVIVEITADPALKLQEFFNSHRTLRGCQCFLGRTANKTNGRVSLRIHGEAPEGSIMPKGPDVAAILATLWGLKEMPLVDGRGKLEREIKLADAPSPPASATG